MNEDTNSLSDERIEAKYCAKYEVAPGETTFFGHYLAGWRDCEAVLLAERGSAAPDSPADPPWGHTADVEVVQRAHGPLVVWPMKVGSYVVKDGRIAGWDFDNVIDERPDGTYTLHSPIAASGNSADARSDETKTGRGAVVEPPEPVAWKFRNRDPWGGLVHGPWYYGPDEPNREVYEVEPLYAAPVVPSSLPPEPEQK